MANIKNPFQPLLDQLPAPMRNRYFLVLVLFFAWMIFFDRHDFLTQWQLNRSVNRLEKEKEELSGQIKEAKQERLDLEVHKEKFAREQYYMKKNNEEVFIIPDEAEE
ncbi:MAG TPA: septum formation initiator family protein [Saprospiraceae bacterium]|nr:septum formation initiator family protein [Saprospiraceae bacterium]HMQ82162.1 septum formation initiator family protein [Saprospiraceae bacterium]